MNYIVLDLEFNNMREITQFYPDFYIDNPETLSSECPNEIIEVGAVKLDKNLRVLDSFKAYIKPKVFNILNPKISEFTGIREEDLESGIDFAEAMARFNEFVGKDSVICTWAKDDVAEIIRNANYHKILNMPWLGEYIDIQEYSTKVLGEKNSLSLKNALYKLRIKVNEAELHDALNDAKYTAEVFKRVFNYRVVQNYIIRDVFKMPAIMIKDYSNFELDESKTDFLCPKCNSEVLLEYPLTLVKWRYLALGHCKRCKSKLLQEIIVKKNLIGDKIYNNSKRVLKDSEYIEFSHRLGKIV